MQQKIFIGLILTMVIVIFIPLYWATEPGRQGSARERQQAEAMIRGAELYTLQCAACHGPAGEGKIGPALKGHPQDEAELEKAISRGITGTAMPAFGEDDGGSLKEHQIKDLITFIKNWDQSLLKGVPAPPAAPSPMPSPIPTPPPITSSTDAAELFAEKCSACHGKNREGISGFSGGLNPESLAESSDDEVRDIISGGRDASGMPPFNNILSPEEIDALLQFIKHTSP